MRLRSVPRDVPEEIEEMEQKELEEKAKLLAKRKVKVTDDDDPVADLATPPSTVTLRAKHLLMLLVPPPYQLPK